jgi:broad specificity phosphatase PhoE
MILVRHGQSAWNVVYAKTRVDPKLPDPGLTEEGRRQAELAAARLGALDLKRLIASPYTRAIETAEIIAGILGLAIEIEPLVREHGRFHCDIGSARSLLARRWPAFDFAHLEEEWWPATLDESEAALAERSRRFRERMTADPAWAEVAVVSHWGFIRNLTGNELKNGELLGYDPVRGAVRPIAEDATG